MNKLIPYLLTIGIMSGIASYDAASQTKAPKAKNIPQKTLDSRVIDEGRGYVKGTILDVDENSFLIEGHYNINTSDGGHTDKNTGRTFGNYIFETVTMRAEDKKLKLIHVGPSGLAKGDSVSLDYEVIPMKRMTFSELLFRDYALKDDHAQSGIMHADGIIGDFDYLKR